MFDDATTELSLVIWIIEIDDRDRYPRIAKVSTYRFTFSVSRKMPHFRAPSRRRILRYWRTAVRKSAASFASPGATVSFFWPSSGFPQLNELTPPLVLYLPLSRLSI